MSNYSKQAIESIKGSFVKITLTDGKEYTGWLFKSKDLRKVGISKFERSGITILQGIGQSFTCSVSLIREIRYVSNNYVLPKSSQYYKG